MTYELKVSLGPMLWFTLGVLSIKGREWLYQSNPKLVEEAFKPEPRTIRRVRDQLVRNVNCKHNKQWVKCRDICFCRRNNWQHYQKELDIHSWSFINER